MTENLGPLPTLRERIAGGLVTQGLAMAPLDRLRSRRDNRPGLHTGCVDSETYAAQCRRRVEADQRCELLRRQVEDLEREREELATAHDDMIRVIAVLVDRLGGSTVITFEERVAAAGRVVVATEERLDGITIRTRTAGS